MFEPRLCVQRPFKKPRGGALEEEQRALNSQLNALRVRLEHGIGWIKNWASLATRWRCAHTMYTSIVQVVCGLVNKHTLRRQAASQAYCA